MSESISTARALAAALLAAAAMFLAAPSADADSGATDFTAAIPAAAAEITPGLCAPGDTPQCVGPDLAQIHLYSLSCAASGTFEGKPLIANEACGIDLSAFMAPSLEGLTKPSCLTSHTYTSDRARAFGRPVNEVMAGGVARKMQLSYPAAVLGFRTATGWVDGPDGDKDPVGDHTLIFSIQVRPLQTTELPCFTGPVTRAELTAVLRVFDAPAA